MCDHELTASSRLRHLDYEALYGGYAETFRRMDQQLEQAQQTLASIRRSPERTPSCPCTKF